MLSEFASRCRCPAFVLAAERAAIARILHAPMHVLGRYGHALLDSVSIRPARSVLLSSLAALFRTAVATLPSTVHLQLELERKTNSSSIGPALSGQFVKTWRSYPIVTILDVARSGFRTVASYNAPKHIVDFSL